MKMKKTIIGVLSLAIVASQLCGCAGSSRDELSSMVNTSSTVEIEVSEPISSTDSTTGDPDPVVKEALRWEKLGNLSTYVPVRRAVNEAFGITGASNGSIYVDGEGNQNINNTLYNALKNTAFTSVLNDPSAMNSLSLAAADNFIDLSEGDNIPAVFNSYWDLLPEEDGKEAAEFNGSTALTRAQAMTLVMRAMTQVTDNGEPKANADFTNAVGGSLYTDFASYMSENVYMGTADKSLTSDTFNGSMTRAEYIYMVMNAVYGSDEVASFNKDVSLSDCKDGGDIASEQSYTGNNGTAYEIAYMLQNPDGGVSTKLYKAIAMANDLGIISEETRWDESITKSEAIQIFIDTVKGTEAQTDKAEGEIDIEGLTTRAKAYYAGIKDNVTCDEEIFVYEVVEHVTEWGESEDDALINIATKYKKPEDSKPANSSKPVESKPIESKPTQSSKPVQSSSKPVESKPTESKPTTPQGTTSVTIQGKTYIKDGRKYYASEEDWKNGNRADISIWGEVCPKGEWVDTSGGHFYYVNGSYYYTREDYLNDESPLTPNIYDPDYDISDIPPIVWN